MRRIIRLMFFPWMLLIALAVWFFEWAFEDEHPAFESLPDAFRSI